jgi:hypothetical protein
MKPVCLVCGGAVVHGNIYCSVKCAKQKQEENEANAAALVDAGFVQDTDTPNVYRRDGVSITMEHINADGMEKVLSHHETVTAIRAHALGVRASEPEAAGAEPTTH